MFHRNRAQPKWHPVAIESILVPIDHSEPSYRAAKIAVSLAESIGATLILLHLRMREKAVRETVTLGAVALQSLTDERFEALLRDLVGDASVASLERIAAQSRVEFETSEFSRENAIEDYAKSHGVDLIVVGAHTHSKIHDVLMGNVAEHLVENAGCAVMVMH